MMNDEMAAERREEASVALSGVRSWDAFPAGLRLELATAEPPAGRGHADLIEPFVPLGHRGRFSRTLLGRVVGPTGESVREVALRMQSDEYPVSDLEGWSNPDIDEQWREQCRLWRLAAAAGAAPAVVDVLPAADGEPAVLPPTLYCKQRRAFFPTPCPQCGSRLETCRDGAVLEASGLPRYERSLERFLYCKACHHAARPTTFYALILADPSLRSRAPVGEQMDLFAALGGLADRGGPLPCAGCEKVVTCYPARDPSAGDAVRWLTPLSFYEYRCLPLERLHLHYDEFAHVLAGGGAGRVSGGGLPFDPADASVRRYLFQDDPTGKLPLEILRLKLGLFGQLASAVSDLHRTTRLPHLALAPENVMVEVSSPPTGLPALYNFRARLLGIGGSRVRRFDGLEASDLAAPILEPPPVRDVTYSAPLVAAGAGVHRGQLSVHSVTPAGGRVVLDGELTSDAVDVRTLGTKDALHITVRQGRPIPLAIQFLANPTVPSHGVGSVHVRSTPVAIEDAVARQLGSFAGHEPMRVTFGVYPCLHAPSDLYSLGMMLFTTLLADAEQGAAAVVSAVRGLAARVVQAVHDVPVEHSETIAERAAAALREAEEEGWLAPHHLCERPSAQRTERTTDLGPAWHAALLLGLRAVTRVPGFSFCRAHDDFDPAHPEGPVDHLRAELRIIEHTIDAGLLAMHGKRREVADAIARVRGRLAGGKSAASGGRR
jgi:hypothetical protein